MKNYKDIIRELRIDKDLKQSDVAKVLGIRQQHYSKYEIGEHEMPIWILESLANYYNVSTDFLLGRTKCRDSGDVLNSNILENISVGEITTDILNLSIENRIIIVDIVKTYSAKERAST